MAAYTGGVVDLGSLVPPAGSESGEVLVTIANFEQVIGQSTQKPVVLMVGTSRSPDSETLRTTFKELSRPEFVFAYVDADTAPEVAQALGVQALPTTLAVMNGQPVANFPGVQPKDALEKFLEQLAPAQGQAPVDPRLANAASLAAAGDIDGAIAAYERILAEEPTNTEARRLLDAAQLARRVASSGTSAGEAVTLANADPLNAEKAFAAADAEAQSGELEAAFDRLLTLMAQLTGADQAADKESVKARLLELFQAFAGAPEVTAARRRLASLLY
ncbi:MAG: tetratricopeptide repeat protein [Corynebacterium sp.]|nr:tetratricopeptide repeat protein [Corynebacterium sp.]